MKKQFISEKINKIMQKVLPLAMAAVFAVSSSPVFSSARETYIVTLKDGVSADYVIESISKRADIAVGFVYSENFNGFSVTMPEQSAWLLSAADGVESVRESFWYSALEDEEESVSNLSGDVDYSLSDTYRGEGRVIAVIDSGFDADSEYLKLSEGTKGALDRKTAESKTKKSGIYVSDKVPFAYDYTDGDAKVESEMNHGTAVAAILAANGAGCEYDYFGAVPEAQLLLMKVFDDDKHMASEEYILAALEDAVKLGADVINLSLGSPIGNPDGTPLCNGIGGILDKIYQNGTLVVCAAGNRGTVGEYSYFDDTYAIRYPLTSTPDIGTISSPASVESTVAVAAGENASFMELYFTIADGTRIKYTDSSYMFLEEYFSRTFDGQTLEYVVIGGLGEPEDYENIDVKGKIALVERGVINFADKAIYAQEQGAVGIIVYNNVEEESYLINMDITGSEIPALFISLDDGILMKNAKDKSLTISFLKYGEFENPSAGRISEFSSAGPNTGMGMKPDVTATGDRMVTLNPDGTFGYMSGTSFSAPVISGLAAASGQMLADKGMSDSAEQIKRLMMSSADVIYFEDGDEISPRYQGAGFASFDAISSADALLTLRAGDAKVDLGDSLKNTFSFTVTLKNISDTDKKYSLYASAFADDYVTYKITDDGRAAICDKGEEGDTPYFANGETNRLSGAKIKIGNKNIECNPLAKKYTPYTVSLKAGESADILVKVTLSSNEMKKHAEIFENGYFVEGFVYAKSDAGEIASIPYSGFCGDWESLSIFDAVHDSGEASLYEDNFLLTEVDKNYFGVGALPTGYNVFDEEEFVFFDEDRNAISPNGDGNGDVLGFSLSLLRSAENFYYTITNSEGKEVYTSDVYDYIPKNYPDDYGILDYDFYIWDGSDGENADFIYPDGDYTLTFYAEPISGGEVQSLSIDFAIDTRKVVMEKYELVEADGRDILRVTFADNGYLLYAMMYESRYDFQTGYYGTISPANEEEKAERGENCIAEFDVTDRTERYIYIDAWDYAYNQSVFRIDLKKLGLYD